MTTSKDALFGDPQLTLDDFMAKTGLPLDDVKDGLHELRAFVQFSHDPRVLPLARLFAEFDKHWMDWDPGVDALLVAAEMINDPNFPTAAPDIANHFGWQPRRLNPALAYLFDRKLIEDRKVLFAGPHLMHWVQKNEATRRFLKSRA